MPTPGTSTIAGSAPRIGGRVGLGVALVVGRVVARGRRRAARAAAPTTSSQRRVGGRSSDQRAHLGAQEVVRARRAERGQRAASRPATGSRARRRSSVKWPDLRRVGRGQAAQDRGQGGGAVAPLGSGSGCVARRRPAPNGSGRPCSAMNASARADDLQRAAPRTRRSSSPQAVMPWPPRMQPIALRVAPPAARRCRGRAGSRAAARATHTHPVAEALLGQRLAVGGGREGDAGVGVQVVDVRRRRPGRASRCRC